MREVRLELLRPDQIEEEKARVSVAYLPVGPLEWHGPAAPFGTDPLNAYAAALRSAQELGGVVLPPLYIGTERERKVSDLENMGFQGEEARQYVIGMDFPANSTPSYYFREEIFALTVREYLRLLVQQGYALIVIVNGHGAAGQVTSLDRLATEFTGETASRVIVTFPAGSIGLADEDAGHATRAEISTMMALTDSVDLSKLAPMPEKLYTKELGMAGGAAFGGKPNADYTVTDEPRLSTKEIGKRYVQAGTEAVMADVRAVKWRK